MYETFGAAYPLESVYSMNNMSHSLGLIPELESSPLLWFDTGSVNSLPHLSGPPTPWECVASSAYGTAITSIDLCEGKWI